MQNMEGRLRDSGSSQKMANALAMMQVALQLLDESGAPAHIGAHLDLAIVRLQEQVSSGQLPN